MDNKSNVSEEEVSPTVSRFGRTRKPKISADFCDIDEVLLAHKRETTSPLKVIKTTKQSSLLKPVKKLQVTTSRISSVIQKDLDVYMNTPKQIIPLKTEPVSNQLKLIKISGEAIKNRKFFKSKPTVTAELEDNIDVPKVMKLVGNSGEQPSRIQKPISDHRKTLVKTYGNKRRAFNRPSLESFGLPDEPIIPVIESNVAKPKHIQSLDVDKPSRNVTLIDKVNAQWQAMNSKGPNFPKYCINKIAIAKTATKPIQEAKIAQQIDQNLRTQKFDLRNVINLNFNTLQKNVRPEDNDDTDDDDEDSDVIELDDDDEFQVSAPLHKNKIIIHSNELITPAKKLPPKVKILEDIIFKNSNSKTVSNNNSGNYKIQMSEKLETDSSEKQLLNLEYTNEPAEDLVDENVMEEVIFDSSKDDILETDSHSLPIDSDSICSSMSVENISLPNENTIITFSPDYTGEGSVVPAVIDEESFCAEEFDGNEETVFTTEDNDILYEPEQESPVLILINDGENIIIDSNLDEVEGIDVAQTSESKEDEESNFEEGDFNLQIDLGNPDPNQELKITEEDGSMLVLDEDMVSQLSDGYIILQGDLDPKENSAEELAEIAILNPDLKDDIEEGTQYILQCTASEDLQELVIDTSAEESLILPEETLIEEASTSQEPIDIKEKTVKESKENSDNVPENPVTAIKEFVKSPEDNLPINRKSYKAIRDKIRLEAKNILKSKDSNRKKSPDKHCSTAQKSKSQSLDRDKNVEATSSKNLDTKASPKRNKSRKQQDSIPKDVAAKDISAETPSKSPQRSVKVKEASSKLETPKKTKTFSKNSTEDIKTSNVQIESPEKKKDGKISIDGSSTPKTETPRKTKTVVKEKQSNESKKPTTPVKKQPREHQSTLEESKTPGRTKIFKEYKKSSGRIKLLDQTEKEEKIISEDYKERKKSSETRKYESRRIKLNFAEEVNAKEKIIKSPAADDPVKSRTPRERSKSRRSKVAGDDSSSTEHLPELKTAQKVQLETETNKTVEEITKSNKQGETEKLGSPKKKHNSSTREKELFKNKSDGEKPVTEQNKKKIETPKKINTDKTKERKVEDSNLEKVRKDKKETLPEESEGKLETPTKRKTNEKLETAKLSMGNEEKNESANLPILQGISEKADESIKSKSLEENTSGTSRNIINDESSTLNLLEAGKHSSQNGKFLKAPDSKLVSRDKSPAIRKSLRSLPQEVTEIKVDQSKPVVKQPSDKSPGMRMDKAKSKNISLESLETKPLPEKEHLPEKSNRGKSSRTEKREISAGKRKSTPKDKEEGEKVSTDAIEEKRKSSRFSHPKDQEQKVRTPKTSSEQEVNLDKENKEKALSEKRKSSHKDQEPKVASQIEITEVSSDKDKKQQVTSDSPDSKDKRKSSRFSQIKEQKPASPVATLEASSFKDKEQDEKITTEASLKDREQDENEKITIETSSLNDEKIAKDSMVLSEKKVPHVSQQVIELIPETLSEKDTSQIGSDSLHQKSDDYKVIKQKVSVEKRKSLRSKDREQKVATPEESAEKMKSEEISLTMEPEQQMVLQIIPSEDSSDKMKSMQINQPILEKRKSLRSKDGEQKVATSEAPAEKMKSDEISLTMEPEQQLVLQIIPSEDSSDNIKSMQMNQPILEKRKSLRSKDREQKVATPEAPAEKIKSDEISLIMEPEQQMVLPIIPSEDSSDKMKWMQMNQPILEKRKSLRSKDREQKVARSEAPAEKTKSDEMSLTMEPEQQMVLQVIPSEDSSDKMKSTQMNRPIFTDIPSEQSAENKKFSHLQTKEDNQPVLETTFEPKKSSRALKDQKNQEVTDEDKAIQKKPKEEKGKLISEGPAETSPEKRKLRAAKQQEQIPSTSSNEGTGPQVNKRLLKTLKDQKNREEVTGDDKAIQKEEKGKSISEEPTEEGTQETSPEKRKLRATKQQEQIPSTSSNEETSPQVNKKLLKTPQDKIKAANVKEVKVLLRDFSTIKCHKQEIDLLATPAEQGDKRKSTRLSQINTQTQDQHMIPQIADKRKYTKSVKDVESVDQENATTIEGRKSRSTADVKSAQEAEVSTEIRKTRSGKDLELMKQESTPEFTRRTRSKDVESLKSEGVKAEVSEGGMKSRSTTDVESVKAEVFGDRKSRSATDVKSLKSEGIKAEVSGNSRKSRSATDVKSLKSESIKAEVSGNSRKSKSATDVISIEAEVSGNSRKSRSATDVISLKLAESSGDSKKYRSAKDIENVKQADISMRDVEGLKHENIPGVFKDHRTKMNKEMIGIDLENILPQVPGVGRITRSKDLEGMKQENFQEVGSGKIASTKDTEEVAGEAIKTKSSNDVEVDTHAEVTGDRRKSARLFSPKEHKLTQLDIQNDNLVSEEHAERRKSSRISFTNTVDEKLGVKRLLIEDPNITTMKNSEDVLMEKNRLEIVEPKKQKSSNVEDKIKSPKKKTNKDIEGHKMKKITKKFVKEPKIVVKLRNIHNSWTNINILDEIKKSKVGSPRKRTLRSMISEDTLSIKVSPRKYRRSKMRKVEHEQKRQLYLEQENKSEEKRRSARVSELKPVSYNEHAKLSGESPEKAAIPCSNSLKDILDDVEYIKRAVLNSSQDDVTDDKKTIDDETAVKIKEEVIDDEATNVLLREDEIKKEIKEEPLDDDLSQEHYFNDGDLAYAKLGHFPYWPCLITKEPDTDLFKDIKIPNLMYHVRFFGDKGRRSWVREKHVIPLKSKDDLNIIFTRLKQQGAPTVILNSYRPNPKIYRMWEVGLNEALSQLDKTVEERYEFFFNMFASAEEKLKKTPIFQKPDEIEIKSEKIDEAPSSEPKKAKYSKSPVKKPKPYKTDSDLEVEQVRRKRGRPLKQEPEEETADDDDVIEVAITGTSTPELKKTHLPIIDLSSECSLSDTDSSSRWSIRTPIVCTSENQAGLYKRNSLFKGVQREKVCQKCLKPGEIFKCRGKCFGYYHKECSMFKVKVKVEVEKEDSDCQIVLVKDKKYDGPKKLTLNTDKDFREMTLAEQIDFKLREIMTPMLSKTIYADSTSDYTSSEDSSSEKCSELMVEHVTADDVILVNKAMKKKKLSKSDEDFRCSKCASNVDPECFACGHDTSPSGASTYRQKCSINACGKFFHPECLKVWPQTQISLHSTSKYKESGVQFDSFSCPMHMCHICVSDDPRASISRLSSVKIVRCLKCPATYHSNTCCVPAGTEIVSSTQIVCPRHLIIKGKSSKRDIINTKWCFICSEGGDLICCETCPTSVHAECSQLSIKDDDTFICEECETGRLPLYDEIVWVKLGKYRWWPALILFPNEIPENVKNRQHQRGEFVVKFFGTHDHYWVNRGRVFLFQEGDEGPGGTKKRMDQVFKKAVEEAAEAHAFKTEFKKNMEDSMKVCDKPPPYIRIKVNKPVGNVKQFDGNISNTTPCNCNPKSESPCGPDSYCINRLLMTECDPEVCPAREKCQNQRIEKRQYPPLVPYKTKGRGWGLRTLVPIKKGEFVIEYVGEVIDDQEYQRRMTKMHEQKDDNYYFLTIDKDRMIDAGPKGNVARFMNHCCEPNCETQKWTVKGDTRVGLFAKVDIPENTEVTFNYNLESAGEEKKICMCGAESCSGFIGVKVKNGNDEKKMKKLPNKIRKKRSPTPVIPVVSTEPCFLCGEEGETFPCHNKICTKYYHLKCVKLETKPDGKWSCPWHNCNLCSKRTIRCCVKCINSYCPVHSEGNVRHDKLLGFICTEHDPTKEQQEISTNIIKKPRNPSTPTEESDVTSTTHEETEELLDNYSENSSVTKLDDTLDDSFDQNESSDKKKRGRRLKKKYPARKRIKLHESHKNMNVLANSVTTPEIILTSSVPERHLRTNRKVSEDSESERLLKRQRAYEKDLPIRKRTTPRTESTENK